MKRYTPTLEAYSWADDDVSVDAQPVMQEDPCGRWVCTDDLGPTYRVTDGHSLSESGTIGELLELLLEQTRMDLDDLRILLALGVGGAQDIRSTDDAWIRVTRER